MKKYLCLLLFVFITSLTYSQIYNPDIIYLKNGNIIKGEIIERIPDKEVKIKTASGSVFVYQADEIDKITNEKAEEKEEKEKKGNASTEQSVYEKKNGYIGLTIGASIPVGEFASDQGGLANTGLQINLINFGYLFTENIGIAAAWFGAANPVSSVNGMEIDPWSYGGLMLGPLFSAPFQENITVDFRPMLGYANTTVPDIGDGEERASSLAFSVGTVLRFDVSDNFLIMLTADYLSTTPTFDRYSVEQPISTFTLGVGAAFKLN